ncbi:MAG: formate dehydrogenase accessory protein FdhE [Nitrospirae bacterium]|nr:formate dehydrogenase accessory protein FdhE [Nitrospirota bacterium]
MDTKELAAKKPHLQDAVRFYEKVLNFLELAEKYKYAPSKEETTYKSDVAEVLLNDLASSLKIPQENIQPLKEALLFGRIDFRRLPLNEIPSFQSPYHEDELASILYILGMPFLHWYAEASGINTAGWENGKCPVCGATPSFAVMKKEDKKTLFCSFCGTKGTWRRIGCPSCMEINGSKIEILEAENEESIRLELCSTCKCYIKAADEKLLTDSTSYLLDLISLPLDIVAQQKGFKRLSPNPLGLKNLV